MKKIILISLFYSFHIAYAQHPWMIKDINTVSNSTVPTLYGGTSSSPSMTYNNSRYYAVNGVAVFMANDGIHGDAMWRTDGTANGTYLMYQFPSNYVVYSMYEAGGLLYFTLSQNSPSLSNTTLWRTDGTTGGTFQILSNIKHNITADLRQKYSQCNSTLVNNNFYFLVIDTLPDGTYTSGSNVTYYKNNHSRIYKTDGTVNGTVIYYDPPGAMYNGYQVVQPPSISQIGKIGSCGNNIYITGAINILPANWGTSSYAGLYRGDENNIPVYIFGGGNSLAQSVNFNETADLDGNCFLFSGTATVANQNGIYSIHNNENTPTLIETGVNVGLYAQANYRSFIPKIGNKFFYRDNNVLPKVTDGTLVGTYSLSAPNTTTCSYYGNSPSYELVFNGAYFYLWEANNPNNYIKLDSLGTYGLGNNKMFYANNKLFYNINGTTWISDIDGTNMKKIFPASFNCANGTYASNNFIAPLQTNNFSSHDAGYEPGVFNTNFKLFTGVVSNDWNMAGNWYPSGVPTISDDVYITYLPATQQPVITTNSNCKNITLCNSNLTITGSNLTIGGNINNYNSLIKGTGNITLNSTNGCKIWGSTQSVYPNYNTLIDLSNVYINATDVSFGNWTLLSFSAPLTFQTNNKILAPFTSLNFMKKPFISNFSENRYIVTRNGKNITFTGVGSLNTSDSTFTFPIGSSTTSYSPITCDYAKSDLPTYTVHLIDSVNQNNTSGSLITNNIVNKKWELLCYNYPSKIKLSWQQADELAGFNRNSCYISNYSSNTWNTNALQVASISSSGLYTAVMNNYSTSGTGPLVVFSSTSTPLTLLNFQVQKNNKSNISLSWQTVNELNTSFFVVQRSLNAVDFNNISRLQAIGLGNNSYSKSDSSDLQHEKLYYRLQIIDKDGSVSYSKIISIINNGNKGNDISIYPNPTKDNVSISNYEKISKVQIINALGIVVKTINSLNCNSTTLSLSDLPKGIYQLKIFTESESSIVKKIVKN